MTCHANDRVDHTTGRSFVYVLELMSLGKPTVFETFTR